MARNLLPFFNAFNSALETLKKRCDGDPARLALLVANDEEVRRTAGWMYFETWRFERLRSQKRYIEGVPPWFIECFGQYKADWAQAVESSYGTLTLDVFSETNSVKGLSFEEIYDPRPSYFKDDVRLYLEFVPGNERAAAAIEAIMRSAYESYGSSGFYDAWMLEGVEAWDFFRGEVQIDFVGIERRWRALPRALIPMYMKKTVSNVPYAGVAQLQNDAVNAYLAGALAASVMACRTIVEHLLKTAYVPHKIPHGSKDPGLQQLIDWALQEPNYPWIWNLRLRPLKDFADRVVHRPPKADWGRDAEAEVVKFLDAVVALIEKAPNSNP